MIAWIKRSFRLQHTSDGFHWESSYIPFNNMTQASLNLKFLLVLTQAKHFSIRWISVKLQPVIDRIYLEFICELLPFEAAVKSSISRYSLVNHNLHFLLQTKSKKNLDSFLFFLVRFLLKTNLSRGLQIVSGMRTVELGRTWSWKRDSRDLWKL